MEKVRGGRVSRGTIIGFSAVPVILVIVVYCLCYNRYNIFGYKLLSAEEFNEYRLCSLEPFQPHLVPFVREASGALFSNGREILVAISHVEQNRANEILRPDEKTRLDVISEGYHEGWRIGTEHKEAFRVIQHWPESPEAPLLVPNHLKTVWRRCWQHGYRSCFGGD